MASLAVTDPPQVWGELGFAVEAGSCRIGGIRIQLGSDVPAGGPGIVSWALAGLDWTGGGPGDLDGLVTGPGDPAPPGPAPGHPNGAVAVDHVVVVTPDFERTVDRLESAGLLLRRRREPDPARPVNMAFFRVGETILEVVERPTPGGSPGPARFWGLAITVSDIDATAALLGDRLRPVRPALQPGRSIAAVDRACGSDVELAFMSPDPRRTP